MSVTHQKLSPFGTLNRSMLGAITKSGTGTWDVGRGDARTWVRGDSGTRGLGDSGARGRGDSGTRGRGTRGLRNSETRGVSRT